MSTVPHNNKLQKFLNSINTLLIQNQIFGLITFTKNLKPSKIRKLCIILILIIYICAILYCMYNHAKSSYNLTLRSTTLLLLTCCGSYISVIWLNGLLNEKKYIKFLIELAQFDCSFQQKFLDNCYKNKKQNFFKQSFLRFSFLTIYICYYSYNTNSKIFYHVLSQISLYLMMILSSVSCHQVIEFVSILKTRFKIINTEINKLFSQNNKEENLHKKFYVLAKICSLHLHLSELVILFNKIFGLVLLFMFGVSFLIITLSLFYVTSELQASEIQWKQALNVLMSSLTSIVDTIYVCTICYSTTQEVITNF